jgi:N-acetylmuramoyl-L-alanine amidase
MENRKWKMKTEPPGPTEDSCCHAELVSASPLPGLMTIGAIIIAVLIWPLVASGVSIVVLSNGLSGPAEVYQLGKDEYIGADLIARALMGDFVWDSKLYRGQVAFPGHFVRMVPDNPFISVDGKLTSVPVTPQFVAGKLMICVSTVPMIFSGPFGREIKWDSGARTLSMGVIPPNIKAIDISSTSSETKAVLNMSKALKWSSRAISQEAYEVFLEGGVLDSSEISKSGCPGFVHAVDAQNAVGGAKVTFYLNKRDVKADVSVLTGPDRLLIRFTPEEKETAAEKRTLQTIVIDPGHGGPDPGAVGQKGLEEKGITLDIAKRLAEMLEDKLHLKVVLTRSQDVFVSLADRARIANESKADLFISVHCNASPKKTSCGTETYFLSVAKTDWARAVEARENAVIKFELPEGASDTTNLSYVLWDLAQNEFLNESSQLAELVHAQLTSRSSGEDRGLNQANFYVLRLCYMPAVLAEVAFVSNKEEEKLLRDPSFRQKAAEGLFEAIKQFKEDYDRKLNL